MNRIICQANNNNNKSNVNSAAVSSHVFDIVKSKRSKQPNTMHAHPNRKGGNRNETKTKSASTVKAPEQKKKAHMCRTRKLKETRGDRCFTSCSRFGVSVLQYGGRITAHTLNTPKLVNRYASLVKSSRSKVGL